MTTDNMMDLSNVELAEKPTKIRKLNSNSVFEDLSEPFHESSFGQIDFEKQYASSYFIRLEALRAAVMNAATERWITSGRVSPNQLVGHVKSYKSVEGDVVLVGVIFKDMSLKPNVLHDIQCNLKISDQSLNPTGAGEMSHKLADQDTLFLEDMEARLQLVFPDKSSRDSLPTGLVAAVLGRVNEQGFFDVQDICLPGCLKPANITSGSDYPEYVAFVSGLQLGSPKANPFSMQLLRDFLMGVSMDEEDRRLSACISRVILAGDTLFMSSEKDPTASALADADIFLSELAAIVPVDVMSGPRDPVNYCLPQQPLHSGLFSEARRYRNLNVRTNPYKFKLGNTVFLGTSGQNILDLMEFTSIDAPLDALTLVAQARYLAPTAPDTLGCYPFTTKDPLVIEGEPPAVMFAGNQVRTSTSVVADGSVRLACIADFTLSPCVLLININDLNDIRMIEFKEPSGSS